MASYALGNAAFHSSCLYSRLRPAIPHLVQLLQDPLAKTRSNAAGTPKTSYLKVSFFVLQVQYKNVISLYHYNSSSGVF